MPRNLPKKLVPALPVGAVGFIQDRNDMPGHLAAYSAQGVLSATFGYGEPVEALPPLPYRVELVRAGLWALFARD